MEVDNGLIALKAGLRDRRAKRVVDIVNEMNGPLLVYGGLMTIGINFVLHCCGDSQVR